MTAPLIATWKRLFLPAKATSSWILRTFEARERLPLLTLWKSLVLPIVLLRTLESTEEGSHTGNRGHPMAICQKDMRCHQRLLGGSKATFNVLSSEEKGMIPDHIYLEGP